MAEGNDGQKHRHTPFWLTFVFYTIRDIFRLNISNNGVMNNFWQFNDQIFFLPHTNVWTFSSITILLITNIWGFTLKSWNKTC